MSERGMRSKVTKMLRSLNAIAVENPVLPGTPDVNYVEGWIELKWLRSWPKRAETIVHVDHYSPQQRVWSLRRRKAGGQAWFLLQCRREWLLLDGVVAALNVELCTRQELIDLATAYWRSGIDEEGLKECLLNSHKQNAYILTEGDEERLRLLLQSNTESPSDDI